MADPAGVRRLEAILAADVAGYSRLMQDDDEATVATLEAYRAIFREKIETHRGRIVDMAGDSILAVFEAATGAVRAAFEIQAELAKLNEALTEPRRMRFRIGVNLGEVIEKPDGTVYGDGVNIAARLESIGEPGGVTVSGTVFDHVKNRLQLGFDFIGEQQVKNIAELVRAYRVVAQGQAGDPSSTAGRKKARLRIALIAATAAGVLSIAGISIWRGSHSERTESGPATSAGLSIAVLPFDNLSGDPTQEYFADGVTEEVTTELSRFRNLRVAARHNVSRYKGHAIDTQAVGRDLGVRYVLEGSVRNASDEIRITAQLIAAQSGSHIWAETYQRAVTAKNIFEIQQEIGASIAAAIGGDAGVVLTTEYDRSRSKATTSLTAYECYLQFVAWTRDNSRETHGPLRDCLEKAVELDPTYADAWAALAGIYVEEDRLGYNPRPGSLDRALKAAQRAVQLAPNDQFVQHQLAFTHFFRGERDAFIAAGDLAVRMNPNEPTTLAEIGLYKGYVGHWDEGLPMIAKALALDPHPPGWYYFGPFFDHYRKGEYEAALAAAQKIEMPDYIWAPAARVAAFGQLGRVAEAQADIKQILQLDPNFEATARQKREKWFRFQEPLLDQFMDGLRKAGLKIPAKSADRGTSGAKLTSVVEAPTGRKSKLRSPWQPVQKDTIGLRYDK